MIRGGLLLAAVLWALPCRVSAADDPRFLTLNYAAGSIFHIATSPEAAQTVLFAPGERVRSVIVSDPGAYQVGVNGSSDGITVKANGSFSLALVSVRTDQRNYEFELVAGPGKTIPSVVRFSYAGSTSAFMPPPGHGAQAAGFTWRMAGNKALRPSIIRDDGAKTYIQWDPEQALPAIFAVGTSGGEEMVEGYVRGNVMTIDRVYPGLVFRINRERASAERIKEKPRRGQ